MVWRDSYTELDYYHRGPGEYCYCEKLLRASDLTLQADIADPGTLLSGSFFEVAMYQADGVTLIAQVGHEFQWYIARRGGKPYFVAKLKAFTAVFCDNPCFVLKVTVLCSEQILFEGWTEQYCIDDCCEVATGISITGSGVSAGNTMVPETFTDPVTKFCHPILRIEVAFDCKDNFTGNFYGGGTPIAGSGAGSFPYTHILNINATKPRRMPQVIERQISYNGRVQRSESIQKYTVQSFEEFPDWKAAEIEDIIHGNTLKINGKEYIFPGGQIFTHLYLKGKCLNYFRLDLPLELPRRFQIFGCGEVCPTDPQKVYLAIPTPPPGVYYSDAGILIGTELQLDNYLRAYPGVTAVNDYVPIPPLVIDYYKIKEIEGADPGFVYADGLNAADRIYTQDAPPNGDFNILFGVDQNYIKCNTVVLGVPIYADEICNTPIVGTLAYEDYCNKPAAGVFYSEDEETPPPIDTNFFILAENGDFAAAENNDLLIKE